MLGMVCISMTSHLHQNLDLISIKTSFQIFVVFLSVEVLGRQSAHQVTACTYFVCLKCRLCAGFHDSPFYNPHCSMHSVIVSFR
jgi:uncharacterized membrane protein YcaP (DUF421 family)